MEYNFNEQHRIQLAVDNCVKLDYALAENTDNNYAKKEDFAYIYNEVVKDFSEQGKSADEILGKLGEMIKESATAYISEVRCRMQEENEIFIDEQDKKTAFGFETGDSGLNFTITNGDRTVAVDSCSFMISAVEHCVGAEIHLAEQKREAEMDISEIASPEVIDAISLCEDIDLSLNGEPEMSAYYAKMAEQELKNGKSENEVLHSLGVSIKETVNLYLEAQKECADETYERDVYDNSYPDFSIDDGELTVSLECCDREYDIKDGISITDVINEAIDEARDEYEAEHEELEYDD